MIVFHGDKKDALTNKPLFNDRAWIKVKKILKEMLMGHCSDLPNTPMFMHQVDEYGEPKKTRWVYFYAISSAELI